MGSGHILVYAFDVLMQIYETAGYSQREAAKSILEHNLYGLDIDDRAFQLAYFAVMMKARQYNRRILNGKTDCHVYSIQESNGITSAPMHDMGLSLTQEEYGEAVKQAMRLVEEFHDAKEYGSILNITPCDWDLLRRFAVPRENENGQMTLDVHGEQEASKRLQELINIGKTLAQKYDVVVTNPPYMGASGMGAKLSAFLKKNYPDSKSDLFACFIERCGQMAGKNRYQAMITQHAWMFLSSFEKLRAKLLQMDTVNMAHLGARAFDEIGGEVVQTTSFVLRKSHIKGYKGVYCRLIEPTTQKGKENMFLAAENRYTATQDNFSQIPGSPLAYWVSYSVFKDFSSYFPVSHYGEAKAGMTTGDNNRFLRLWYEVRKSKIGFGVTNSSECIASNKKWFPYNKGGGFRKWYGLNEYVVLWENDGEQIKEATDRGRKIASVRSERLYFRKSITWATLTTSMISARFSERGHLFDDKGSSCFLPDTYFHYVLSYINSVVGDYFLHILNPTMSFQSGNIGALPIVANCLDDKRICGLCENNVERSKTDWDSFETSWDFTRHPLVHGVFRLSLENALAEKYIQASYMEWEKECTERFNTLKSNEEELNRIFIDIYDLQDELTPKVEDKDVTVRKADLGRDIRSLISYAVGCMFGRYSLDRPGLVFAGGDFNKVYWKYKGQAALDENGEPIEGGYAGISMAEYHYPKFKDSDDWEKATSLTFEPDVDNVLPITDEEYFEDDIVGLFCAWLKKVYGSDTLEENLDFIAKALGNKGNTSREVIRNYFLNDFFKDHCKTYSVTGSGKRPIYWLFDSGKQNGFKALIYMHRYDENTIGNLRIDYLHRMERVYDSEIARMQDIIDNSSAAREVTAATKRKEKLQKQVKECKEYDEKIAHLALARIAIDLDDGVKVNYEKVQTGTDGKKYTVLAKI